MSNQTNDAKETKNTDINEAGGGFDQVIEFCKKNKLYIAAAVLLLILIVILIKFMGSGGSGNAAKENTETMPAGTEVSVLPEDNLKQEFEKDKYPEINTLIKAYYKAYAKGNLDKLQTLADPISDVEKSYISAVSQYVGKYKNISCYTKPGYDEGSFIVSVCLEIKFKKIATTAPGLETFYISKREDGSYYINNLYGLFNSKRNEFEVDQNVSEFIQSYNQQEDVAALQAEIQQQYEAALASDEELKTMVESTIPNSVTVEVSDQIAAAKKAEEEAKKAAEEEAAKKAEEEKKAAEMASAVTVYATDKVNVRAQASETADILGQLEIGTATTRLEDKDGWSRIDYNNGTEGYVKSEFLSTEAPSAQQPAENQEAPASDTNGFAEGTVITIKESVNVRKSMGEDAEKIATAFAGEKVTVIMSYAEGWTKVTYGDKTGFIKTELLK